MPNDLIELNTIYLPHACIKIQSPPPTRQVLLHNTSTRITFCQSYHLCIYFLQPSLVKKIKNEIPCLHTYDLIY